MRRGEFLAQRPHEFEEDVDDGSMCMCGVPALTHQLIEPTEPCDHGSYYLDDAGMRHCLTCPDVRPQPTVSEEDHG